MFLKWCVTENMTIIKDTIHCLGLKNVGSSYVTWAIVQLSRSGWNITGNVIFEISDF